MNRKGNENIKKEKKNELKRGIEMIRGNIQKLLWNQSHGRGVYNKIDVRESRQSCMKNGDHVWSFSHDRNSSCNSFNLEVYWSIV